MSQYLGIDVGTQGVKALVWDQDAGRVVGRGGHALTLQTPRPGAAEQDPAAWLEGLGLAVAQAFGPGADGARADAVAGLAVSGQQHGLCALDETDRVVRPAKLWCDTETAAEASELSERLGRAIPAGFTAPKVLWMARHEPEVFARVRRVLLPHDFVNLFLTGEAAMECGDASGTGWFDPVRRTFDEAAMAAVAPGLEGMVPRLIGPHEFVGTLRAGAADSLGLPAGIPVASGSGDNMMSAVGAGATRPGVLVASLGTSGTLFGQTREPVVDREGMIAPFCDATGAWLPLLCTMNCTTVLEEVRRAFGIPHEELTRLAAGVAPGADGLTFLPYLAGERAPDWPHATGVVHGLRAGSMGPGPLYRAAVEGATFALFNGFLHMQTLGTTTDELRVVGGGSKNPLWRQMIADTFGCTLRFPTEPESAALGAALQAMVVVAHGGSDDLDGLQERFAALSPPLEDATVEPDPARREASQEAFVRFRELGKALFGSAAGRSPGS